MRVSRVWFYLKGLRVGENSLGSREVGGREVYICLYLFGKGYPQYPQNANN